MKKFSFIILGFLFLLTGCSSLNNLIDEALPTKAPTIPVALQEQIATKINPENEIYSVGYATIDRSGSLIAQAKANKQAKDLLKEKVKKEVKINFNSFLLNSDTYSKSIISPVLSDLSDYTVDLVLKNASQKGAWENETSVYSLFSIERDQITNISKQVFTGYLGDISGKLNNIRQKIDEIQTNPTPSNEVID